MESSSINTNLLVIVVTFNGMKWLEKCLSSVNNSSVKADLFIIDNGSTDNSIKFIKQNYPKAILVESKENLGFGKANNLGLKYAIDNNYDYVYLLNQDAWVETNTFEDMINVSIRNPEYYILSPLQTNKEKTKLDRNFSRFCSLEMCSDYICNNVKNDVYEASCTMAAHWLISYKCLLSIGGFSPIFKHYGEDLNYIDRIHFKKHKIGIVPACIGVHDREDREESIIKKKYLFFSGNVALLSNPNIKKRYLRLLYSYMIAFIKDRDSLDFKYFLKTISQIRKIHKIRLKSYMEGAFLTS